MKWGKTETRRDSKKCKKNRNKKKKEKKKIIKFNYIKQENQRDLSEKQKKNETTSLNKLNKKMSQDIGGWETIKIKTTQEQEERKKKRGVRERRERKRVKTRKEDWKTTLKRWWPSKKSYLLQASTSKQKAGCLASCVGWKMKD